MTEHILNLTSIISHSPNSLSTAVAKFTVYNLNLLFCFLENNKIILSEPNSRDSIERLSFPPSNSGFYSISSKLNARLAQKKLPVEKKMLSGFEFYEKNLFSVKKS